MNRVNHQSASSSAKKPKILITNDDGIQAPGIWHLWHALKDHAEITIVAPSKEQSAVALSITIRDPLVLKKMDWEDAATAWHVNGTPADCVKMALSVIMDSPPDLIVSGINRGSNAGRNVLYSGTVGGVIEGVLRDIPGIAFSCYRYHSPDYQVVEKFIPAIVDYVLDHKPPQGTLLNVNFPDAEIKGFKFTRQGKEFWGEAPDERNHPHEGHSYYWMGAKLLKFDEHEDSDITWLQKGYVTAVPIHVSELTDHDHLNEKKSHFEALYRT